MLPGPAQPWAAGGGPGDLHHTSCLRSACRAELPVGAQGLQAAAGDCKDRSSLQRPAGKQHQHGCASSHSQQKTVWPHVHVPWWTPVWPHVQHPTANTSVVSCSMSHSELRFGLTSNIPQQTSMWPHGNHQCGLTSNVPRWTPVWPHVQHPMTNTSVVSCLTSHGELRFGLTSSIPRQTSMWPHIKHQRGLTSNIPW